MTDKRDALQIPGENSKSLHTRREKVVPRGAYHVTDVYVKEAKDTTVIDVDGNEYIDFAGGIGIQNIGHTHPKVVKAIQKQAEEFIHTCFHVAPYEKYITLAERLNEITPGNFLKKTMFANSGAEAVENAVKIARKYTGKQGVISFERAFHGRTLLAMSLASKVNPYKHGLGPFAPETYKLPYPYYYRSEEETEKVDDELLKKVEDFFLLGAAAEDIGAIIIEPVQGEGGFIVPSKRFLQGIKRICEENNIVFIADEIQTGFCRTGKMFAMEHFGIEPDIMTMSKSLAAGMPLSAVTGRAEIMDAPEHAQIGGTFGGNPLSCAASLAVLDVIEEEDVVTQSKQLGDEIQKILQGIKKKYPVIGDVRGLGPMCAIELVKDRKTKEPATELTEKILRYCYENGVFVLSAGIYDNVLRFLPPVTMKKEPLQKGFAIVEKAFQELTN